MIRLSTLNIKEINRKGQWKYGDPEITGVETSSFRIKKGYIFVAKPSKAKGNHGALFSNKAFKNGADYIVVGRPIRDAGNPRNAAEEIQSSISECF